MKNTKNTALLISAISALFINVSHAVVIDVSSANADEGLAKATKSSELQAYLNKEDAQNPEFGYWNHVGKVGMGTGIYLGNGYVLTSAHVGCYPFRMQNGTYYKPVYKSWKVLRNANGSRGDLAIFRVNTGRNSALSKLASLPVSANTPDKEQAVVMMGAGLKQSDRVSAIRSNGKILAILGYHTEARRAVTWGVNVLAEVPNTPVKTGKFSTHCFTTQFDHSNFEAQAAHGDSGGPAFTYNQKAKRWELAGCIVAVTQKGLYVPVGSQTYIADMARYISQLPSGNQTKATKPVKVAAEPVKVATEPVKVAAPGGETVKPVKVYPALIEGVFPD